MKRKETNGKLAQLTNGHKTVWIGWGIIALLWTVILLGGIGWIKSIQSDIEDSKRQIIELKINYEREKVRLTAVEGQTQAIINLVDRINNSIQAMSDRLIRIEQDNKARERK